MDNKEVNLEIEASKAHYNDIKHNAEAIVRKILIANNLEGYNINLNRKNMTDVKWATKIIPAISEELLGKKGYHVTNVGYSLGNKPTIS